jgi:hypothetical protein
MLRNLDVGKNRLQRIRIMGTEPQQEATVTVKVGGVEITAPAPDAETVAANLDKSRKAMEGLVQAFVRPGIRLYPRKGVPLYSADPDDPSYIIRKLDGLTDRGVFVNGVFEVKD